MCRGEKNPNKLKWNKTNYDYWQSNSNQTANKRRKKACPPPIFHSQAHAGHTHLYYCYVMKLVELIFFVGTQSILQIEYNVQCIFSLALSTLRYNCDNHVSDHYFIKCVHAKACWRNISWLIHFANTLPISFFLGTRSKTRYQLDSHVIARKWVLQLSLNASALQDESN